MTIQVHRIAAALVLGTFATGALAHAPAGTSGLAAGFGHPLAGLDHLLAMLAVGLWAGRLGPRITALAATLFVSAIGLGFVLAASGLAIPVAELGVVGSLLVFGLLVAFPGAIALRTAAPLLALLGACHGQVHGLEAGVVASSGFLAGLLGASLLLVVTGAALSRLRLRRHPQAAAQVATAD